jgi:hypothetical protein
VPDIDAICQNLKIIQELSNANKFIIIIPLVGNYLLASQFKFLKNISFYKKKHK